MELQGIATLVKLRPKRLKLGTVGHALVAAVAQAEASGRVR